VSSLHFLVLTDSLNSLKYIGKEGGSGTFPEIMFSIAYVAVTCGDGFTQFGKVFKLISAGIPEIV
jgi:hypothetical protein